MNIKLKYPQKFKKQHKTRSAYNESNNLNFNIKLISINKKLEKKNLLKIYLLQNIILPKRTISFLRKLLRKFFKKKKINC